MFNRNHAVRRIALVSSLAVPAMVLASLSMAQDPTKPMAPTAGEKFKNVKTVLKTLPAEQMIPVMHKISVSLGVKCDFCHVVNTDSRGQHVGWELDDKKMKSVARDMIRMTEDINKRYKVADKKVTCFTCHKGHSEPQNNAPMEERR